MAEATTVGNGVGFGNLHTAVGNTTLISTLAALASATGKSGTATQASIAAGGMTDKQREHALIAAGMSTKDGKAIDQQLQEAAAMGARAAAQAGLKGHISEDQAKALAEQMSKSIEGQSLTAQTQQSARLVKTKATILGTATLATAVTAGAAALALKPLAWLADKALGTKMSQSVSIGGAAKWTALATGGLFAAAAGYDAIKRNGQNSARKAAIMNAIQTGAKNGAMLNGIQVVQSAAPAQAAAQEQAVAKDQTTAPVAEATSAVKTAAEVTGGAAAVAAMAATLAKKPEAAQTTADALQAEKTAGFDQAMRAMRDGASVPAARGTVTEVAPGVTRHTARADALDANKAIAEPAATVAAAPAERGTTTEVAPGTVRHTARAEAVAANTPQSDKPEPVVAAKAAPSPVAPLDAGIGATPAVIAETAAVVNNAKSTEVKTPNYAVKPMDYSNMKMTVTYNGNAVMDANTIAAKTPNMEKAKENTLA